jgi:hypothetical protein
MADDFADVGLVPRDQLGGQEVRAHDGGRLCRCPGADAVLLQQDEAAEPPAGEMKGDAGAHHAAADDDGVDRAPAQGVGLAPGAGRSTSA